MGGRAFVVLRRVAIPIRDLLKRWGLLGPLDGATARLYRRFSTATTEEIVVDLGSGRKMIIPPGLPSAQNLIDSRFEPEVTQLITRLLGPGQTFIDVGANIGYYTLLAARLVEDSGQVLALEPDPDAFEILGRNLALNSATSVLADSVAVGATSGTTTFARGNYEFGSTKLLADRPDRIEVPVRTIDEHLDQLGIERVDLIKMDIEGAELDALRGMTKVAALNPSLRVIFELNPEALKGANVTTDQLGETLLRLGFDQGWIIERGLKRFSIPNEIPRSKALYNILVGPGWSL